MHNSKVSSSAMEMVKKKIEASNPYTASSSTFLKMLSEIVENDNKKTDEQCVSIPPIAFWTQLFAKYFLHINHPHHDDLLFYVKKDPASHSDKSEIKVFRRESPRNPGLGDPAYDWTETVYLNLILQQLQYKLTCAICTKKDDGGVQIHNRVSQIVYASPSRHDMDEKGQSAELSYPNIFFPIDSFDEIWTDLHLNEGQMICVEILAHDKSNEFISVIFLGSVSYTALFPIYEKKTEGLGTANKLASLMSMGLYKPPSEVQFVKMKGPGGKGYAEMAVEKYKDSRRKNTKGDELDDEAEGSMVTSKSEPEFLSDLPKRKPKTYLTAVRNDKGGSGPSSAPVSPSLSKKKPTSTSLKTQLTYITLPWHKIILDVLKSYECPMESKKPVLGT